MSWVKVDDKAWSHPKFADLSGNAVRLWLFALCWCNQQETDGLIPKGALRLLGGGTRDVAELVNAGLWHVTERGWQVHDFLAYQPSKAQRNAQREATAERVKRHRSPMGNARESTNVTALHSENQRDGNTAPVPDPVPDPLVADGRRGRGGDVPCPVDLELTPEEFQSINAGTGMTAKFVEKATPQIRARFLSGDPRSLAQWRRSLQTALITSWSDPEKRDVLFGVAPPAPPRVSARGPRNPVQPSHGVDPFALVEKETQSA